MCGASTCDLNHIMTLKLHIAMCSTRAREKGRQNKIREDNVKIADSPGLKHLSAVEDRQRWREIIANNVQNV